MADKASDKRPMNVLLITADQWRADCLSIAGHPMVKTPHTDALAREGVRFARHYTQAAPCQPGRASLLTSLYQMNHRVGWNGIPLDHRHDNIARALRRKGHEALLVGYTDTAPDPREYAADDPVLHNLEGVLPGFDRVAHWGTGDVGEKWANYLRKQGVDISDNDEEAFHPFEDYSEPLDNRPARYKAEHCESAYLTDALIEQLEAQRSLQKSGRGLPWLTHLSVYRPHPPFIAPEPFNSMYNPADVPDFVRADSVAQEGEQHPLLATLLQGINKSHFYPGAPEEPVSSWDEQSFRQIRANYYGLITKVDEQIGRIVAYLKETDQYDNTLIVLTTDHAEQMGDHYLLGKLGYFDQSFNIPLIIRDPNRREQAGRVVEQFTGTIDVAPTILDCLGYEVPRSFDGHSLKPFLEGETPADWRTEIYWEFDYRIIREMVADHGLDPNILGRDNDSCALAVQRGERYKYVHFADLPPLLFDLQEDPSELINLAQDPAYASVVLDCAQKMLDWRMRYAERTLTELRITSEGPRGVYYQELD
ncbi:alkaline phosphatase family protein [Rhodovibrionaceae bacterium A322]